MTFKKVNNKIKVFLFMGQSNEDGGSSSPTHSLQYRNYDNSFIFFKPNNTATDNGEIQSYKHGVNNTSFGAFYLQQVCSQTTFGKHLYEQTGETILMIKYAKGGSALVDSGESYANGNWEINANLANGTKHYPIALNNFFIPAINKLKAMQMDFEIVATFWCQGESDSTTEFRANLYQDKLIELFDRLKYDLNTFGVLAENYKPIITRIHNNFTPGTRPYMDTVRTALENVANHYSSYWIDSDAYSLAADLTHYNYLGQEQHGIDRANIIINNFL